MGSGEKPTQGRDGSAQFWHDKLLEPIARRIVNLVALAKVADADGDVGLVLVSGKWGVGSGFVHHI